MPFAPSSVRSLLLFSEDAYEFQKSLGSRWTIRGSIGLGVLAIAVQFIVFRLVLVENLPPSLKDHLEKRKQQGQPLVA